MDANCTCELCIYTDSSGAHNILDFDRFFIFFILNFHLIFIIIRHASSSPHTNTLTLTHHLIILGTHQQGTCGGEGGWREGGREGGTEEERDGGSEGGGMEGGREGGTEEEREGGREGGRLNCMLAMNVELTAT